MTLKHLLIGLSVCWPPVPPPDADLSVLGKIKDAGVPVTLASRIYMDLEPMALMICIPQVQIQNGEQMCFSRSLWQCWWTKLDWEISFAPILVKPEWH